jgi:hypothetical protein
MNEGLADDVDAEAEEVLNELNLLTESEDAQNDMRAAGNSDQNKFLAHTCYNLRGSGNLDLHANYAIRETQFTS